MFKEGRFYRHVNTLDIDLYIVKTLNKDDSGTRLRVKYYNRHYHLFQPDLATTDDVLIKPEQYANWVSVIYEQV